MMISTGYSMMEQAGSLLILWMTPSLPLGVKLIALTLLVLLPLLFFFRNPAAAFADRQLHFHLTPRALAIGAPVLSILCGVLLFFSRPREPMIRWDLNNEGISVTSLNGTAAMRWTEVTSATFDLRNPDPNRAALVLKSKDGNELWLVISWLIPQHREKVLAYINHSIPGRFNPPTTPRNSSPALPVNSN